MSLPAAAMAQALNLHAGALDDPTAAEDLRKILTACNALLDMANAPERMLLAHGDESTDVRRQARHELRTPINVIKGYGEMLAEDADGGTNPMLLPDLRRLVGMADGLLLDIDGLFRDSAASVEIPVCGHTDTAVPNDSPVKHSGPQGQILAVDDIPENLAVLSRRLERLWHSVATTTTNGKEALHLLQKEAFDLVLLDVMMPEMDGYEVLSRIKSAPQTVDIPVVIISALNEMASVVRCLDADAEDYLPKPFDPMLLRARVGSCLEKKRLRDQQRELFGKFATSQVVDELMATGFTLGGKYVNATVMFFDIRSFTTIAEALSPAETIDLLNNYFGYVMGAIESEGGVVNQMIGDGLMAIFGAPLPQADHRERAVLAALKMMERMAEFNRAQAEAGKQTLEIGIGIASGQMIAGFAGSEIRATYTCVGDTVNLAARLEAHTKIVKQPILIDENTRVGLSVCLQAQGSVQLKGKTQAVNIFSVMG